jgi:hypothetical protein
MKRLNMFHVIKMEIIYDLTCLPDEHVEGSYGIFAGKIDRSCSKPQNES